MNVQCWLMDHWGYPGPIDGMLGPESWKAMQRALKTHWGYTGAIDGIAGTGTPSGIQKIRQRHRRQLLMSCNPRPAPQSLGLTTLRLSWDQPLPRAPDDANATSVGSAPEPAARPAGNTRACPGSGAGGVFAGRAARFMGIRVVSGIVADVVTGSG